MPRISECHPSLWHSPHLTARFSGPRSQRCLCLCPAKLSPPLQVPETAGASPCCQRHLIVHCLATCCSTLSRGFSLFMSLSLQWCLVWKTTVLTVVFVTNKPQPPQRRLSWGNCECDLPQWNVAAVSRVTVKAVLYFAPPDPFPQFMKENKAYLAVRIANSGWHLKAELCSPSIIIHPQPWNLYFTLNFVDAEGKIIHHHDNDTRCC